MFEGDKVEIIGTGIHGVIVIHDFENIGKHLAIEIKQFRDDIPQYILLSNNIKLKKLS